MYREDRLAAYDSPYLSNQPAFSEEGPLDQAKNFLSDHGKAIIAVIILLATGYFLYDFFIGSYQNVSFNVQDNEGNDLDGAQFTVTPSGQTNALFSHDAPKNVSIKRGEYEVYATANGFLDKTETVSITPEKTTVELILQKRLSTQIESVSFPRELFLGQTATASITLKNAGSKTENIELAFPSGMEGIQVTPKPSGLITLAKDQTKTVELEIVVDSQIELQDEEKGDSRQAAVQVRFTDMAKAFSFTLRPAIQIEVSPQTIQQEFESGQSAEQFPVGDIEIANNSEFDVENIQVSLQLDSSAPAGSSNWFSFNKTAIDKIRSGEQETITLYATVPPQSNQKRIAGQSKIKIQGATWSKDVFLDLTIQPLQTSVAAQLSAFEIELEPQSDGSYPPVTDQLSIEISNEGSVPVEQIDAFVDNACRNIIQFTDTSRITNLPPGESQTLRMEIRPLPGTEPRNLTCKLSMVYEDPLNNNQATTQLIDAVTLKFLPLE